MDLGQARIKLQSPTPLLHRFVYLSFTVEIFRRHAVRFSLGLALLSRCGFLLGHNTPWMPPDYYSQADTESHQPFSAFPLSQHMVCFPIRLAVCNAEFSQSRSWAAQP